MAGGNTGTINRSYSIGSPQSDDMVGGLVGYNEGSVSNSYWDTQTSGTTGSDGGVGRTTAQMMQESTFSGWSFSSVWSINEGTSYPYLRWE